MGSLKCEFNNMFLIGVTYNLLFSLFPLKVMSTHPILDAIDKTTLTSQLLNGFFFFFGKNTILIPKLYEESFFISKL